MRIYTFCFVVLSMIFFSTFSYSQNYVVKGKVTDAKGEVLIGVNIIEKGTSNGTATDNDGRNSLGYN